MGRADNTGYGAMIMNWDTMVVVVNWVTKASKHVISIVIIINVINTHKT